MKIKKKLALIMATVATVTCIGATTAFADDGIYWEILKWNSTDDTYAVPKHNESSGMGNVDYGNDGSTLYMQLKGPNNEALTRVDPLTGKVYIELPRVKFDGNVTHYVDSNAWEARFRKVRMNITGHEVWQGSTAGWWVANSDRF